MIAVGDKTEKLLCLPIDPDTPIIKVNVEGGSKTLYKTDWNQFKVLHRKDGVVRLYGPIDVSELRVLHSEIYRKV